MSSHRQRSRKRCINYELREARENLTAGLTDLDTNFNFHSCIWLSTKCKETFEPLSDATQAACAACTGPSGSWVAATLH